MAKLMRAPIAAIISLFLMAPSLALAQMPLWGGLTSGMTEAEILRAMPAAKPSRAQDPKKPQQRLLAGDSVDIEGATFTVTLTLSDGRLEEVMLISEMPRSQCLAMLDKLSAALTTKYGQRTRQKLTPPVLAEIHWQSQVGTTIELAMLVGDKTGNIFLKYNARLAATAKRL